MGKEMQIKEGMTFGELAKEFQGEFPSAILLAKQGNSLKELDYQIPLIAELYGCDPAYMLDGMLRSVAWLKIHR